MALRKPLVLVSGEIEELTSSDTLDAVVSETDVYQASNSEAGAITIGMAVYVYATGAVKKAKADASGTSTVIGLVADASIASAASGSIQTDGYLTSADWTAITGGTTLTAGAKYYLSAGTAGQLTTTPPSSAGQYVAPVGQAISTTTLEITILHRVKLG
jgi:hypothetical protein